MSEQVQPSREDVLKVIYPDVGGHVWLGYERAKADAILALFKGQPTVAQIKADAWDEGFEQARLWNAAPMCCNPYRDGS